MSYNNGVGLNHVGAYQASGRPWCKHFTITGAQTGFIEFPNVTKSIWAHVDYNGTGHSVQFAFCEPTRAVNMRDSARDYLEASSFSLAETSVSFWFKFDGASPPQEIRLANLTDDLGNQIYITNRDTTKIRLLIVSPTTPTPIPPENYADVQVGLTGDVWYNIVLTCSNGEQCVYFNGEKIIELEISLGTLTNLYFGSDAVNFDGAYSQMYFFDKALSEAEVSELYTTSARLNPNDHSASDNLLSYWATDDGAYGKFASNPDTTGLVKDRKSNNDLVLRGGSNTLTFEDGWTIGNALESHSITSTGHTQISFPFKCNKIFYSTSNNLQFSMFASLTNIPASQMFPLTGPGIDE